MRYFAYGSNMSVRRLRARISRAYPLGHAVLPGHELRFHKVGKDGSGKCDAWRTDDENARLDGVLYEIGRLDKFVLDRIEGRGVGYAQKEVLVEHPDLGRVSAVTYYATRIEEELLPFDWYRYHVLVGAREAELPEAHQQFIEEHPTLKDPDSKRAEGQMAIYGTSGVFTS